MRSEVYRLFQACSWSKKCDCFIIPQHSNVLNCKMQKTLFIYSFIFAALQSERFWKQKGHFCPAGGEKLYDFSSSDSFCSMNASAAAPA